MANKTRADILAQVYEYVPNANVTSHNDLTDNLADLAVEVISAEHDFTYLRSTTPATHDVLQTEYTVAESDFSFTNLKEITHLQWVKAATGEHNNITHLPEQEFHARYGYVSYSGNSEGKPMHYTRAGNTLLFNCALDETVTVRAWYQQYHGNFTDDNTSHSFQPDNLGFQVIVAVILQELHTSIPGLELSPKAQAALMKASVYVGKLVMADLDKASEPIVLRAAHTKHEDTVYNPYNWTT